MTAVESGERSRLQTAGDWLLRLRAPHVSPEVVAGWLEWCGAEEANREAFDRMQAVWDLSDAAPGLRDEALQLPDRRVLTRNRLWAAAAALVLVVGAAWVGVRQAWRGTEPAPIVEQVRTQRGEHEDVALPDGSHLALGGQSSVALAYDQQVRRVILTEGEAFFTVHPNKTRPFIVMAGPLTVTAIGTSFNVRRDADSVFVTVAEGTVDVRARSEGGGPDTRVQSGDAATSDFDIRARGGHQVRYHQGRMWSTVDRVDPSIASGFQEGKLQYVDEPLSLVVASINRYAERPIVLDDPALGEMHFTGTVFERHIEDWLQGLDAVFPVRVTTEEGRVVISRF